MTAELKMYTLAKANPTMQADLGTSPFRWFDVPMPQAQWTPANTCLRFRRVSTQPAYNQGGLMNLEAILYQFEILAQFLETARAVANDFQVFMDSVDLCSNQQFGSPVTQPNQHPCFLRNRRESADFQLQPVAQIVALDYRVYNRTDL